MLHGNHTVSASNKTEAPVAAGAPRMLDLGLPRTIGTRLEECLECWRVPTFAQNQKEARTANAGWKLLRLAGG